MTPRDLKPGDVVQLAPNARNQMFAFCMMTVTEPKPWGAQGYVQMTGLDGVSGPQAFYRAKWEEMEYVGRAEWVIA